MCLFFRFLISYSLLDILFFFSFKKKIYIVLEIDLFVYG